jgi:hypothetical protein
MARLAVFIAASFFLTLPAVAQPPSDSKTHPNRTSPYNIGDSPGRFRSPDHRKKFFSLKAETSLFDGGGREIGRVTKPVTLNIGACKRMNVDGKADAEFMWAWRSTAGSGWIARSAFIDPPPFEIDTKRDPKPPREAKELLTIHADKGTELLKGLRHTDFKGIIPDTGGNKGEHYAGQKPGPKNYVYLLFACPNVKNGGVARDSIPDGAGFVPAQDDAGKPITETMTMYRAGDFNQPVPVTFLYGRAENSNIYGWLARANIGER